MVFPGYPCFLPKKTDRHNITEILLKVVLNTINQPNLNIDNIVKNNIPLMKWIIVKNYNIVKYQLKLYFRSVISKLLERWSSLRGRSAQDCIRVYLAVVRKWQYCGAKLFQTKVSTGTTLLSRFGLSLWCLMPLFNNISVILWRKLEYPEKPPTCRKSLTSFIT